MSIQKSCQNCEKNFLIEPEDLRFYEKFAVPAPKFCPNCRQQRRLVFRNDRTYYMRQCDLCRKSIVSIYSSDKPFPVYCKDCFWSDRYDPLEYGQNFDFDRPFFEQYAEMRVKVPRIAIFNTQSENADYTVHSSKNRNCYMSSSLVESEDVLYSDRANLCKDCMDLYMSQGLEQCYFCMECDKCYHSCYLENCFEINFSYFCFDCRSSNNLIGCVGLRNKEYMVLNKPVSKEETAKTIKKLNTNPVFRKDFYEKYNQLRIAVPVKYFWEKNSENCSGNFIVNSKNAHSCYSCKGAEDVRYCYDNSDTKDTVDATRVGYGEMLYEVKGAVDLKFSKFCNLCYQGSNLEYCDNCQNSHDCFGCMSLKNNRNCILNKQRSPAEYAKLLFSIKDHMKKTSEYGEFFPIQLSPYGYNETKAQDFFPLTKGEVLAKGFKWKDVDLKNYQKQTYNTPPDILDVKDDILEEILACKTCSKNYKIIAKELGFYRTMGLPVPVLCPDCRHRERLALQNPRTLYDRSCQKCSAGIKTTYSPARPEKVYCDQCYLRNR